MTIFLQLCLHVYPCRNDTRSIQVYSTICLQFHEVMTLSTQPNHIHVVQNIGTYNKVFRTVSYEHRVMHPRSDSCRQVKGARLDASAYSRVRGCSGAGKT